MELTRRGLFSFCAAGAAGVVIGGVSPKQAEAALGDRTLTIYNTHTGEWLKNMVYWSRGRYLLSSLQDMSILMRDHRNDEVHRVDPRLCDILYRTQRLLGANGAIHMVSGYRSPKTNAMLAKNTTGVAKNSYHLRGQAIDVFIPGVRLGEIQKAGLWLKQGGVGFYPNSGFVHLDSGPVRKWGGRNMDV
jgi:uncharacterized protein YcbK (DUF882 family)